MNIDQAFPSKYLKASDLPEDGVAVPFTIKEVTTEEIGRDKQLKPVILLQGQEKGFVATRRTVTPSRRLSAAATRTIGKAKPSCFTPPKFSSVTRWLNPSASN
jgi:hypothetical protein